MSGLVSGYHQGGGGGGVCDNEDDGDNDEDGNLWPGTLCVCVSAEVVSEFGHVCVMCVGACMRYVPSLVACLLFFSFSLLMFCYCCCC